MMKTKVTKKSPLKEKPLRYAGQSLSEAIDDIAINVFAWFVFAGFVVILAVSDWIRFLYPMPAPSPWFITIVAVAVVSWSTVKIFKSVKEISRLKMARDGEKLVGEGLQELIKKGATVLHDIQGERFNVDHVVISQNGIFLIETKTYSKPIKKETQITHDKNNIYVDGFPIERNPLDQVVALSKWLQELLQKSTGKLFFIKPVILFPGWYTEKVKGGEEIWILNPKALPVFISHEPIRLQETDIYLVTYHLSRYIKNFEMR